jgi:hypothetical protein
MKKVSIISQLALSSFLVVTSSVYSMSEESMQVQLRYAIITVRLRDVKELIAQNVDVNYKDKNGETALHHLSRRHNFLCMSEVCAILQALLEAGARIDIEDNRGRTPLDAFRNDLSRTYDKDRNRITTRLIVAALRYMHNKNNKYTPFDAGYIPMFAEPFLLDDPLFYKK